MKHCLQKRTTNVKILVIHNFHRKGSASGDDQVFKSEKKLLESNGHEVITYTVSNDSFDNLGIYGKLLATFGMLWSFGNYKAVKSLILKEQPDLVHVHTFFPLLSPSILYAAKSCGKKVVATLHDTRFVCPCATSLRGKELCNKCGDGFYFRMCKYNCFKNSKFQSFIIAGIFTFHRILKTFYKKIDHYICLNDNQIELLAKIGFDKNKISKKYNFVQHIELPNNIDKKFSENLPERYVVFYGRIGEEKGIQVLMNIWNRLENIPLVVMGDGPLASTFKKWSSDRKNILFLGYVPHDICLSIVKKSEFVVFPSIWYEGCSMVEIETESLGKCLIATDLGFSSEAIENEKNGYKVALGDVEAFVRSITKLWNNPLKISEMGNNARQDYELKYKPQENYIQLINIYNKTLKD